MTANKRATDNEGPAPPTPPLDPREYRLLAGPRSLTSSPTYILVILPADNLRRVLTKEHFVTLSV